MSSVWWHIKVSLLALLGRENMEQDKPNTALEQIRGVWHGWRYNRSALQSMHSMEAINAIMIGDGERERRLKTISENARRDRELAGDGE